MPLRRWRLQSARETKVGPAMTNIEFIRQFEADAVPESSFHHSDHVRLAFAYLSEFPPLEALQKFCAALKCFAAARGKSQLYHEYGRRQVSVCYLSYPYLPLLLVKWSLIAHGLPISGPAPIREKPRFADVAPSLK